MDLFTGCRVRKGAFPYADHSWFIYNDKGKPTSMPLSGFDLGMVTDAVWTDYDKDGWEEDTTIIAAGLNRTKAAVFRLKP